MKKLADFRVLKKEFDEYQIVTRCAERGMFAIIATGLTLREANLICVQLNSALQDNT